MIKIVLIHCSFFVLWYICMYTFENSNLYPLYPWKDLQIGFLLSEQFLFGKFCSAHCSGVQNCNTSFKIIDITAPRRWGFPVAMCGFIEIFLAKGNLLFGTFSLKLNKIQNMLTISNQFGV